MTWGWLDLAFQLSARLAGTRLALPLTVVAAQDERLVDNAAAKAFVGRTRGATYVEVVGAYHEILMETDPLRAVFWAAFDRLADRVLG